MLQKEVLNSITSYLEDSMPARCVTSGRFLLYSKLVEQKLYANVKWFNFYIHVPFHVMILLLLLVYMYNKNAEVRSSYAQRIFH